MLFQILRVVEGSLESNKIVDHINKRFKLGKRDIKKAISRKTSKNRASFKSDPSDKVLPRVYWGLDQPHDNKFNQVFQILHRSDNVYRMGSLVVSIGDNQMRMIDDANQMAGLTLEFMKFYKTHPENGVYFPIPTKAEYGSMINHRPSFNVLREIRSIQSYPVFDSNYQLIRPGYHAHDRIFLDGPYVHPAEATPTLERLLKAPKFADKASRANWLGSLVSLLLPTHFVGKKPLVLFEANQRGLGKTTLAQLSAIIGNGKRATTISYNANDEEFEKQIATVVRSGQQYIIIDNAKTSIRCNEISSGVLERSITDETLNFRLLGKNASITVSNTLNFALSANDPKLSKDLISRSLPIRLAYEGDCDEIAYPIQDPEEFALQHIIALRAELSGMIVRWIKAGKPESQKRSYTMHPLRL